MAGAVRLWAHLQAHKAFATWLGYTQQRRRGQAQMLLAMRFTSSYRLGNCSDAWREVAAYLGPLRRAVDSLQGKVGGQTHLHEVLGGCSAGAWGGRVASSQCPEAHENTLCCP